MSEFEPIPITLTMVDPQVEFHPNVHPESRVAGDRREMIASAQRVCTLANNAEFQKRVPTVAWHNLTSQEGQTSQEIRDVWLQAKDEFLEWLNDFSPAKSLNESERAMAYMAVLNATGE